MDELSGLEDKHLASLGRLAVAFGHVEFLTSEILLVFDDEFIAYASDGVSRQLDLIGVLSDERVSDPELRVAIQAWTSRTRTAAKQRNQVVHGAWSYDPDEERNSLSTLGFRHGNDVIVHWNPEELDGLAASMGQLATETQELLDDIADHFLHRSLTSRRDTSR